MQMFGFDNDKYLREQTAEIFKRVAASNNKLYLEFDGKLLFDYHAARVLPGFDPNVKMKLLQQLRDRADIIICVYAGDIEKRKVRADFGITYDVDVLKLIDDLREWQLPVRAVVITRFADQPAAVIFKNKLERAGVKVYTHRPTRGYPTDVDTIVSEAGYGANPYIETDKPLVVVTAPGPNSGKLATCLSQIYHEHQRGVQAGYSKFETFPIWSIPLKHPVNVAYEAATAELRDFNMIDPFHHAAHGQITINYNRDVEVFPVVKRILEKVTGGPSPYQSPTDMGVNRAGFGIVDDEAVQEAGRQEIIRRYFRYACEYAMGFVDKETVQRVESLMRESTIGVEARKVVMPARAAAAEVKAQGKGYKGIYCGAALELPDGSIVTGKNSPLLHATSSVFLNAIKQLAGLPDPLHLLAPNVLESVSSLKRNMLRHKGVSLDLSETLICLAMSAASNPSVQLALDTIPQLRDCEVHLSHIPSPGDEAGLRRIGANLTCDPNFATKDLFIS